MKWLADLVMSWRARRLMRRIRPHLPALGNLGDIGSGTGHNTESLRRETHCAVTKFDVVDIHWIGPGPHIFDGTRLPANDHFFDAMLMLFVLQYPESPSKLLAEVRRVTRGRVIVLQST